jgi:hypothetical protein
VPGAGTKGATGSGPSGVAIQSPWLIRASRREGSKAAAECSGMGKVYGVRPVAAETGGEAWPEEAAGWEAWSGEVTTGGASWPGEATGGKAWSAEAATGREAWLGDGAREGERCPLAPVEAVAVAAEVEVRLFGLVAAGGLASLERWGLEGLMAGRKRGEQQGRFAGRAGKRNGMGAGALGEQSQQGETGR